MLAGGLHMLSRSDIASPMKIALVPGLMAGQGGAVIVLIKCWCDTWEENDFWPAAKSKCVV